VEYYVPLDIIRKVNKTTNVCLLERVDVAAEYQGLGYGTKLLELFIAEAYNSNASAIILLADARCRSLDLSEWYSRHGFSKLHECASGWLMINFKGE
jgi:predicted N-acetyltransferase YhbS